MSYIERRVWVINYETTNQGINSISVIDDTLSGALAQFHDHLVGQRPPTDAGANGTVVSVSAGFTVWVPE